jgi:hypothetical protein
MGGRAGLWVRALNDSVHVLSSGVTPSAALTVWLIRQGALSVLAPGVFPELVRTWPVLLAIPFFALVLLLATGFVRLGYRTVDCVPEALVAKARAATVKHVVFVTLYVISAVALFVLIQP